MKNLLSIVALTTTFSTILLAAQNTKAATITSLAGDKDCFGKNAVTCNTAAVLDIVHEADDGSFDLWSSGSFTWSHSFSLPAGTQITQVVLKIVTLDLEDNGAGDGAGGAPFDDKLFIDGIEVLGAFDTTFTPDGNASTQLPVNTTVFNLAPTFFPLLADGNVNIQLLSTGGSRADAIAVDFAELTIDTEKTDDMEKVPEPSSVFGLLGVSLVGFGAFCKRKLNQK
jgi:hypothetical protein